MTSIKALGVLASVAATVSNGERVCQTVEFNALNLELDPRPTPQLISGELCADAKTELDVTTVTVDLVTDSESPVFFGFELPTDTYLGYKIDVQGGELNEVSLTPLAAFGTRGVPGDTCTRSNNEEIDPCFFVRRTPLASNFPVGKCINQATFDELLADNALQNRNVCRLNLNDDVTRYQDFPVGSVDGAVSFELPKGVPLPSPLKLIYGGVDRRDNNDFTSNTGDSAEFGNVLEVQVVADVPEVFTTSVFGGQGELKYSATERGIVEMSLTLLDQPDFEGWIAVGVNDAGVMPGTKAAILTYDGLAPEFGEYDITARAANAIVKDESVVESEDSCDSLVEDGNSFTYTFCKEAILGESLLDSDGNLRQLVAAFVAVGTLENFHEPGNFGAVNAVFATVAPSTTGSQETDAPSSAPVASPIEDTNVPTPLQETPAPSTGTITSPPIPGNGDGNETVAPSATTSAPPTTIGTNETDAETDAPTAGAAPTPGATTFEEIERETDVLDGAAELQYTILENGVVNMEVTVKDKPDFTGFVALGVSESQKMVGTKAMIFTKAAGEDFDAAAYSINGYTPAQIVKVEEDRRMLQTVGCEASMVQDGNDVIISFCVDEIDGEKLASEDKSTLRPVVVAFGTDPALQVAHEKRGSFNAATADFSKGKEGTDDDDDDDGLSGGAIAGIIIGVIAALLLIALLVHYVKRGTNDGNDTGADQRMPEPEAAAVEKQNAEAAKTDPPVPPPTQPPTQEIYHQ